MAVFDLKQAVVTMQDGAGSPNTLTIKVGEGTLNFTETVNRVYKKDRGKLYTVINGDEEPVDVSIDFIWEFLRNDSGLGVSPEDVLKQANNASAWVSTDTNTCAPYCIDLFIVFTPVCSAIKTEHIQLPWFRYEKLAMSAKDAMVACSGKCNSTVAVVTRV